MASANHRRASEAVGKDDRYRPGYELVAERLLQYIAGEGLVPGTVSRPSRGWPRSSGRPATSRVKRSRCSRRWAGSPYGGAGIFVASGPASVGDDALAHYQPTDMENVLMLLDYRRVIETETARRAASIANPIEVKAIRDAAESSSKVGTAGDVDAFSQADELFHTAVALAAHNLFLQSAVATIRRHAAQSDILLFHRTAPGSLETAGRQHLEIAHAIASGDPELATRLMAEHVETTQHQFERRIRDRLFNLETPG